MLVTNFPGPQMPFYVLGRELIGVYPVGFLARNHALAVAILSYNGTDRLRPARRPRRGPRRWSASSGHIDGGRRRSSPRPPRR